jgi:FkbM family methyltransferase
MNFDTYLNEPLPFERELGKYFHPKDRLIIFDIGSCEGEDTIKLKRKFPNSTIYSFEPLPSNVKIIKKNFKKYGIPDNHVFQIALSNDEGISEFYVSSGHPDELPKTTDWNYGNKSSSLLPPKEHTKVLKWIKFSKKINVKTQRLDLFCQENSIGKIDFIYLDVQGAELMVLQGAGDMLQKVGMIWLEVEAVELYKNQPLKTDVERFMQKNNFMRVKDTVDKISGDQLYVHRNLPKRDAASKIYRIASNKFFGR